MSPDLRRVPVAVAVALCLSLLASSTVATAAPGSNDPRGANRVYEAPGTARDPAAPVIALTFDDGPNPTYTPQILDILKANGIQATFFMVGRDAEKHPDLVRRVVAEGHVIGNHTWDHAHLSRLSDEQFNAQIDRTTQVLQSISGQEVVCTRPPYGDANPATVAKLAQHGQASVVWSADSRDFEKPGAGAIAQHALAGLTPGGIILVHDGGGDRTQTIAALQPIIDGIRAQGYAFATACDRRSHKPTGAFDGVRSTEPETFTASGWARDPDTTDPTRVQVYIDGTMVQEIVADGARPDLAAPPDDRHGFSVSGPAAPGDHQVCVKVLNAGLGDTTVELGCQPVTVLPTPWYDQLGRLLTLLDQEERWDAPPPLAAGDALETLVDTLLPDQP